MKSVYNSFVKLKEGYELVAWVGGFAALLGIGKILSDLSKQYALSDQFQKIISEPLGIALIVVQVVLSIISICGLGVRRRLLAELAEKSKKLDELETQFAKGALSGPEFELKKLIWRPILIRVDGGEEDTVRVKGPMCPKCKTPLVEGVEQDWAGPLPEYYGHCAKCKDCFSTDNDSFDSLTKVATAFAIGEYERGELKFSSKRSAAGGTVHPPAKPRLMDRPNDDLTV